jgi:hypothetical protein
MVGGTCAVYAAAQCKRLSGVVGEGANCARPQNRIVVLRPVACYMRPQGVLNVTCTACVRRFDRGSVVVAEVTIGGGRKRRGCIQDISD